MDPNSTNYSGANSGVNAGGSNAGGAGDPFNSSLGAGTDSISVTGTGAGQNAGTGGYNASQAGSQGSSDSFNAGQQGNQSLGERLSDAKDTATDKLSHARDVAGEKLGQARDAAGERFGQAREKATELKATLADKLDQGADSLRQRAQGQGGQQFAGANGATVGAAEGLNRYAEPAANAMEKTAEFLRDGDLKGAIEEQVRVAPGRSLLIAVGLGYLLGKAIRR